VSTGSIVRRLSDAGARLLLRPATVAAVREHGASIRAIDIGGEKLSGAACIPGDKVRLRVDTLALRTYTPVSWDAESGTATLLAATHADGPGSAWCRNVRPGEECEVRGPECSVRLDRVAGAPILVGDESSFGLAAAWRSFRPDAPAAMLFEVGDVSATRAALDEIGLDATLVERTPGATHRDALAHQVAALVRARPDATLCMTGCAQTIAAVRRHLKQAAVAPTATIVKAYWDEHRKGLD
jgi:ferric-chelate reductase (NADPH)